MSYGTLNRVPMKKHIPGTTYTIDCFNIPCNSCTHYFLTHFHADHYSGLKRSFAGAIYCSETTANLVHHVLRVPRSQISTLCMHRTYQLAPGHFVTCLEANHCPGAVCLVFSIDGKNYLHTGDFRAAPCFYEQPLLDLRFDMIFLDNTFENYRSFCAQRDAVRTIIEIILKKQAQSCLVPLRFAFLFSSYLVGKEKCFLSVAEYFDKRVTVCSRKMRVYNSFCGYSVHRLNREVLDFVAYARETIEKPLQETHAAHSRLASSSECSGAEGLGAVRAGVCAGTLKCMLGKKALGTFGVASEETGGGRGGIRERDTDAAEGSCTCCTPSRDLGTEGKAGSMPFDRITTDVKDTNIFLLSACTVNRGRINSVLKNVKCDRAVVFCGTGWAGKTAFYDLERRNMVTKKGIEVIYVPYSEHSSSDELAEFKSRMTYAAIKNTVK